MVQDPQVLTVSLENEAQTKSFAQALAPLLRRGDAINLNGTLGAGKTAFARYLIQALNSAEIDVPSPTFNLLLTYDSPASPIYHFDFYRLEDPEEVWELGLDEALDEGITLMEWMEKIEDFAPETRLNINISIPEDGSEGRREVSLSGSPEWQDRLTNLKAQLPL